MGGRALDQATAVSSTSFLADSAGAGFLCYLRLGRVGDVHDDAALEHLGQTYLGLPLVALAGGPELRIHMGLLDSMCLSTRNIDNL